MIVNCREWPDDGADRRRRVFVDGVEIKQVWYADTDVGFVRTYDVLGDGKAHATWELIDSAAVLADAMAASPEPWDMPQDGAMSKVVRGTVELRPFE